MSRIRNKMSLVVRKPAFCICENKDADQLRGNREADQRLSFRYTDSTIPLLPKSEIFRASSHLLWLYKLVCVGPGRKPRRPTVFSERGSHICLVGVSYSITRRFPLVPCFRFDCDWPNWSQRYMFESLDTQTGGRTDGWTDTVLIGRSQQVVQRAKVQFCKKSIYFYFYLYIVLRG